MREQSVAGLLSQKEEEASRLFASSVFIRLHN